MLSRLAAAVVGRTPSRKHISPVFTHPVSDADREYMRAATDARGVAATYPIR